MMLPGSLVPAPIGTKGFDCNVRLTLPLAAAFVAHRYQFAWRYVPRIAAHPYDLSAGEAQDILGAGLGLMAVQHVESATSWSPSHEKGAGYGHVAAGQMIDLGFPPGAMCWLDLEGVAVGTAPDDVIQYGNAWYAQVAAAGFLPGVYVGWHAGLPAIPLYRRLRFAHYCGAYNLNRDEFPAVRGVQMRQHAATLADRPGGVTIDFDVDVTQADALGGRPVLLVPDGWAGAPPIVGA